jgi:hypothetical protein
MIYLNMMSYSVLSGCGNCSMPDAKEVEELEPILHSIPTTQRPYQIFFTNSLYKKCLPQYEIDIENPLNFSSFRWTDRKRKEIIDIDIMANSIIACCNLIERLLTFDLELENPNFILYILYKTASNQARFINQHLKVGNIFYNGEDVSDQDSNELNIQIADRRPDIVSQFAVFHAFSALLQLSSYNLYYYDLNEEELFGVINILPGLLTGFTEDVEQRTSKELSLIGLHLTEIYRPSHCHTDMVGKTLHKIGKELCRRTSAQGLLQRKKDGEELASIATTTNSLNLLAQLAYMFASKSSYEASHRLYEHFSRSWDNEGLIFKTKDSNKQKYSIKDVAAVIAALFSFLRIAHDRNLKEILQRQIAGFAETTLVDSGIFNGQYYPILQHSKLEHPESLISSALWAPVFNKGFEYKISKKKHYCDPDVFRADYVLPACVTLLDSINI